MKKEQEASKKELKDEKKIIVPETAKTLDLRIQFNRIREI